MPIPLLAAAAIPAAASLVGGAQNSAAQADANRDSQRWSLAMYERQKKDNLDFWNLQNSYNSPQAQMQRFQQAGLNPHLIYGQGNSGNASPVSTPDAPPAQFRSTEPGNAVGGAALSFINSMYDLEIKKAQIDNLQAQNTVIHEDALLKRTQRLTGDFDLGFKSELRETSADSVRERLRQLKVTTDVAINEDARRAAQNSSSISEAAERMLTMRAERTTIPYRKGQMSASTRESSERVRQMIKDGTLKDLEIELRRKGINPNDPMWTRVIGRLLSDIFEGGGETGSLPSVGRSMWNWLSGSN